MPRIETVSIEDVFPYVDEYGNEFLSRDYSLKENQEYVHELARSMARRGVPDEPVTLARDGGVYRIVAGNSRVMAMRELGTKRFPAVILDDEDVQAAVETAVRTNTKKKYEAVEESRLVQQLALFGSDEYVAEVAGIGLERAKRARRGAQIASDAAEDMTLDHLEAVAELAEQDEAAAARLAAASEATWRTVLRHEESALRSARLRESLRRAAEEAGAGIVDAEWERQGRYVGFAESAARLKELVGTCGDPVVLMWDDSWARASVYDLAAEEDGDGGRGERIDEARSKLQACDAARREFACSRLASPYWPTTARNLAKALRDEVVGFLEAHEGDFTEGAMAAATADAGSKAAAAIQWRLVMKPAAPSIATAVVDGTLSEWMRPTVAGWIALGELLAKDGYSPSDDEAGLVEALRGLIGGGSDE